MFALAGMIIAGGILEAGDKNKFEFDKELYNLANESTTKIKVTEDKGYEFSGKSEVISGQSKIEGKRVKLRLSVKEEDTQVKGFFTPTKDNPNEKELWVNSQKVTVIKHYITSATYRQGGSRMRKFTVYYARVIADPHTFGEPKVTVKPAGFAEAHEMKRKKGDNNYSYYYETNGHRSGGKVFSTFLEDQRSVECVKVGGK